MANNFKKITEEFIENLDYNDRIENYVCDKVSTMLQGSVVDFELSMQYRLCECESPIEQILSLGMELYGLTNCNMFNPFIDIIVINPQEEIECNGKKYRVDFFIGVKYKNQGLKGFVVECDGHDFHQKTKAQVERDNERTRDLQACGYEVIRFSGSEIYHKTEQCVKEIVKIILSKCEYRGK